MAKNKRKNPSARPVVPPKKRSVRPGTWIAGALAILALVAVMAIITGGGSKGAAAAGSTFVTPGAAGASGAVPPEEAKYLGRLLPAGYTEPVAGAASTYSSVIRMTDLTATQGAKELSVALSDVVANKIVYFEYKPAGGAVIPMTAYVKPSGKLFVGVGYCIPCKGTRQRIEADGTLTCESCGTKRNLETGVGISGACRLYPLDEVPAKVAGGKIVIQTSVLASWTQQPQDRPVGA